MSKASGGGLARSTAVMAAGTATSRVLGLVRAMVLVGAVGLTSSIAADAFAAANYLPNVIYMLIAGGVLNAVLVPQVVRAYRGEGGQEYVDRLLTLGGALLLGLTVVLTLAAPLVVRIAVSGADPDMIRLATAFAFWCIPQVFFYGVYTLLGQVLNARGVFGPYMWAPVVNNIVAIAGIGVFIAVHGRFEAGGPTDDPGFWGSQPIALLGGAATLGVITQALVLLVPLRRIGFRYRPRRDWRGVGLSSAARVAGWTFAALLVGQIGILVVTRVATGATGAASRLGLTEAVAGKAAYDYAFLLFMLPHSLVTVSLVTALFTRLSTHAADDDVDAVRRDFAAGLRSLGLFTMLATAVLVVLALPVSRVIAIAGSAEAAGALARVVVAFALGLVALGAWTLVQRVYYAYEDARALFWLQVPMAAVVAGGTLLGSLLLPPQWWAVAAAASIAASYVLGAVRGSLAVRRRLGGIGGGVRALHLRAAAAAAGAAVVGWPLSTVAGDLRTAPLPVAVLVCVVVGAVMAVVYAVLLRVLGVDDLGAMLAPLLRRLPRSMRSRLETLTGGSGLPPVAPDDADGGTRGGDRLDVEIGQGTLLAGRYRLTHPEQGDLPGVEVWSAVDQILDRGVRVSFLREGRTRAAQDAARRAALVSDPRLLRIIDVAEHEGLGYVVTDPLPGRDLAALTSRGPLPPDQARAVIGEAAVALEVARRRGVHHLALRPSVIRVTEDGRVVVAGLAMDGELVHRGAVDARSTTRADTVGLVSLLYLALTGRWPATADVPVEGVSAAPVLGGTPVPPAELTSGVPNDLDTLCAVTLGPHEDGPHSPVELVRELEPWGDVDPSAFVPDTATAPGSPAGGGSRPTLRAGGPPLNVPPVVRPAVESAGLTRTSVRSPVPGATRPLSPPGTPPPAAPTPTTGLTPVVKAAVAGGAAATGAAAAASGAAGAAAAAGAGTTSTGPAVPPTIPPAGGGQGGPARPAFAPVRGAGGGAAGAAGTGTTATTPGVRPDPVRPPQPQPQAQPQPRQATAPDEVRRMPQTSTRPTTGHGLVGAGADRSVPVTERRFDPTPWVLALVALGVILGIVWAWNTFTAPAPPIGGSDGFGDVVDIDEPDTTAGEEPAEGAEGEGDAEGEPAAPSAPSTEPPVIASVQQLDPPPNGDNNEHPEAVDRAIDGDPGTFWFTRTYVSPTYGMKSGVGYALTLEAPAVVSSVTLDVNGAGGMVEIRSTDPSAPTEGEVLASGEMGPGTVYELSEPTEAEHIVLWFPELPQTPEGKNRVELREVTVS